MSPFFLLSLINLSTFIFWDSGSSSLLVLLWSSQNLPANVFRGTKSNMNANKILSSMLGTRFDGYFLNPTISDINSCFCQSLFPECGIRQPGRLFPEMSPSGLFRKTVHKVGAHLLYLQVRRYPRGAIPHVVKISKLGCLFCSFFKFTGSICSCKRCRTIKVDTEHENFRVDPGYKKLPKSSVWAEKTTRWLNLDKRALIPESFW